MADRSPGSSSNNKPLLNRWAALAQDMEEVQVIMQALDNQPMHRRFTEGALDDFVNRLDEVKNVIADHTPYGYQQDTELLADHVRAACRALNVAAEQLREKQRKTDNFFKSIDKARKSLKESLDAWRRIPEQ